MRVTIDGIKSAINCYLGGLIDTKAKPILFALRIIKLDPTKPPRSAGARPEEAERDLQAGNLLVRRHPEKQNPIIGRHRAAEQILASEASKLKKICRIFALYKGQSHRETKSIIGKNVIHQREVLNAIDAQLTKKLADLGEGRKASFYQNPWELC